MRRAAALALAALALVGCETTQEKSAKLEKVAKVQARERKREQQRFEVTRQSTRIAVDATDVLHSSEGDVVLVTLTNRSATTMREVPIEITVRDAHGASVYTNAIPGLATSLLSMALLPAHTTSTWIDDQVQTSGTPASVGAKVGEGEAVAGAIPSIRVQGAHLVEGTVEGSVVNRSQVAQRELVVDAIARRDGAIVAAGSAIVPQVEAGATAHFQAPLIGDAQGAQLEVSAPASTVG